MTLSSITKKITQSRALRNFINLKYIPRSIKIKMINALLFTEQEVVDQIYQTLFIIERIFSDYQIPYWVSYGSLLGTIRHGGLIPWDQDIDICILDQDEEKFLSTKTELSNVSCSINTTSFGYRICSDYTPRITENDLDILLTSGYPYIDLIIMSRIEDKIRHHREYYKTSAKWQHHYINIDELYPLVSYNYGPIKVLGPNTPATYLKRIYGEHCLEGGRIWLKSNDHPHYEYFEFTNIELPKAALPSREFKTCFIKG